MSHSFLYAVQTKKNTVKLEDPYFMGDTGTYFYLEIFEPYPRYMSRVSYRRGREQFLA